MVTVLQLFAATEEAQGIQALGIDPLAILAQAVTFLVLFWIIKKFALNKIVRTLEDRRKTIDNGVRLGLEMEAEKSRLDDRVADALKKARGEADTIIAQAHHEAGVIMKDAEAAAERKTEALIADAHAKIHEDIKRARTELEKEVLSLIAEATEVVIGEKLDVNKNNELLTKALAEAKR